MNVVNNLNSVQVINKSCMSSRHMRLLPRAALRSDSEHVLLTICSCIYPYIHLSIHPSSVHPSVCLSVCLSVYLYVFSLISLSVSLSVSASVHQSVSSSVFQSICQSARQSNNQSIGLSVSLLVCQLTHIPVSQNKNLEAAFRGFHEKVYCCFSKQQNKQNKQLFCKIVGCFASVS